MEKITKKVFKTKKGQMDYEVWTKPNKFLCDYMFKKRRRELQWIKTKKDIEVTVIIREISQHITKPNSKDSMKGN